MGQERSNRTILGSIEERLTMMVRRFLSEATQSWGQLLEEVMRIKKYHWKRPCVDEWHSKENLG